MGYEGQEERPDSKVFEETQASAPTKHALLFLRWEKFLLRSDGKFAEQPFACFVPSN